MSGRAGWLLDDALDVAVPIAMLQLDAMTERQRQEAMAAWASAGADVVASCGDQIQYRTAPSRATATCPAEPGTRGAFAALARGIAAAAYVPGGITFRGRHWCADHDVCLAAEVEASERAAREAAA